MGLATTIMEKNQQLWAGAARGVYGKLRGKKSKGKRKSKRRRR